MDHLELAGAPLAWLWLFIVSSTVVILPLLRGLMRRGSGIRRERSFLIQRAPQLAVGLVFTLAMVSFEAIEFSLGTGEPSFGKGLFERSASLLPIASLAIVLPANLGAAISWFGVIWTALGSILLISGLFTLRDSFSTDSEMLPDQQLRRNGPFRFLLHPVYAGWVHFLLGTAITTLSPVVAVLVVTVVIPLFLHRAKYEESLLREQFGAAFDEFAESRHWRRLIPRLTPVPLR